jgi:hypothetical protein
MLGGNFFITYIIFFVINFVIQLVSGNLSSLFPTTTA